MYYPWTRYEILKRSIRQTAHLQNAQSVRLVSHPVSPNPDMLQTEVTIGREEDEVVDLWEL